MMLGEGVTRRPWQAGRAGEGAAEYSRALLELNYAAGRFCVPSADRQFRDLVRRLHAQGPRPVGEQLLEVARDSARLLALLEDYTHRTPPEVAWLDARDWFELPPRAVR